MNEFIEKNRRLLHFYCVASRAIGWALLIVPGVAAVVHLLSGTLMEGRYRLYPMFIFVRVLILNTMFLGLVVLGVAQFIRYLFERQYQPSLILRNADKILYLYAFLMVVGFVLEFFFRATIPTGSSLLLYLFGWMLPTVAKVLILVGLGQILRRLLPVIEESKTLV